MDTKVETKFVIADADGSGRTVDFEAGRRAFVGSLGLTLAGAAIMGGSAGLVSTEAQAQAAITDADILNFALNLEYLEAEFYLRAVFGRGLSDADISGIGPLGGVSGGRQVPFADPVIRNYANEIASDEEAHVKFLRSALGSAKVARPTIDLNQSFTNAARAASLIGPQENFDPFADETNFLLGAFIFEDVGVTAYKGAAPLIQSKAILTAAAGLLAVEAYHASEIRTVLYGRGLFKQAQLISDLRDSADGRADLDQGIGDSTRANVVPTDANGLAYGRNSRQVLRIVYLNSDTTPDGTVPPPGGFFPSGMNGNIR